MNEISYEIQLWLLEIKSLILDKEMEICTANRELSLGIWLSNHELSIRKINEEIKFIKEKTISSVFLDRKKEKILEYIKEYPERHEV